eukprot:767530-Hanusia_phi.AAC.4
MFGEGKRGRVDTSRSTIEIDGEVKSDRSDQKRKRSMGGRRRAWRLLTAGGGGSFFFGGMSAVFSVPIREKGFFKFVSAHRIQRRPTVSVS